MQNNPLFSVIFPAQCVGRAILHTCQASVAFFIYHKIGHRFLSPAAALCNSKGNNSRFFMWERGSTLTLPSFQYSLQSANESAPSRHPASDRALFVLQSQGLSLPIPLCHNMKPPDTLHIFQSLSSRKRTFVLVIRTHSVKKKMRKTKKDLKLLKKNGDIERAQFVQFFFSASPTSSLP